MIAEGLPLSIAQGTPTSQVTPVAAWAGLPMPAETTSSSPATTPVATKRCFGGHLNAGDSDAFVARYDGAGNLLGTIWFATEGKDTINGVAIDRDGAGYVTGLTGGTLGASSVGGTDVFVARIIAIPEPS